MMAAGYVAPCPKHLDDLDEALRAAEVHLSALNLGVPGSVQMDGGGCLMWTKIGQCWGLRIGISSPEPPQDVLEADAVYRVAAALHLRELETDIRKQLAASTPDIGKAVAAAQDFVAKKSG